MPSDRESPSINSRKEKSGEKEQPGKCSVVKASRKVFHMEGRRQLCLTLNVKQSSKVR